jgi:hypothetical protein
LLQCFHTSKVHMLSNKNFPPDWNKLFWLSNSPILPSTMGLLSLHLGLEQLKDRMIKSSTMSQALCSTIILEFLEVFKIKLRDSILWHSQVSQYVVFVDPHQGNNGVMPFSLPTTKAYVEFIGREKARAYLQCIYCKVKQWIQRVLSHTIKSRYACVRIYGGYIWWLILILLCSSKTYLSFET